MVSISGLPRPTGAISKELKKAETHSAEAR